MAREEKKAASGGLDELLATLAADDSKASLSKRKRSEREESLSDLVTDTTAGVIGQQIANAIPTLPVDHSNGSVNFAVAIIHMVTSIVTGVLTGIATRKARNLWRDRHALSRQEIPETSTFFPPAPKSPIQDDATGGLRGWWVRGKEAAEAAAHQEAPMPPSTSALRRRPSSREGPILIKPFNGGLTPPPAPPAP